MGLSHAQVKPKHTKPWAPGKKPLQPQGIITKMAANKGRPDMPKSTPVKKSSMIMVVALCAAVGSGCSMFSWMGGRSKDKDAFLFGHHTMGGEVCNRVRNVCYNQF